MNMGRLLNLFESVLTPAKISLWVRDLAEDKLEFSNFCGVTDLAHCGPIMSIEDWYSFVLPEDLPAIKSAVANCIEGTANSYCVTVRMRSAGGGRIWVQDQGWVVERDENGRVRRMIGLQQDVTSFKEMEEDLRDRQAQLDLVAHTSGQSFWDYDCRDDRLEFSEHFFSQYGYRRAELQYSLTDWWRETVHPDDLPSLEGNLRDYLVAGTGSYDEEARIRDAWGNYVWVRSTGQIIEHENGRPSRVIGCLINIDRLKQTEEALKKALYENRIFSERLQREFQATEENLRLSKGDVQRQGKLLRVANELGTRLLSTRTPELGEVITSCLKSLGQSVNADRVYVMKNFEQEGRLCVRLLYEWQENYQLSGGRWGTKAAFDYKLFGDWAQRLAAGECINSHVQDLSGQTYDFFNNLNVQSVLAIPIHIDGEFWGLVYFGDSHKVRLSDEPELKALQSGAFMIVLASLRSEAFQRLTEAMKEAQAGTRAKTLFLANMSHEMRTPLNAILGMTEIAQSRPSSVAGCLSSINAAARQLLAFIRDALEMTNLDTDSFELHHEKFLLSDVLNNVNATLSEMARQKKHNLSIAAPGLETAAFYGDQARLTQALNHLVSNSIKFTPENGQIRLEVSSGADRGTSRDLHFSVTDNGIGIDKDLLDKLFLPFEQGENALTRQHDGAGLGLAIVNRVVGKMNGQIHVESTLGQGSVFSFDVSLDVADADEAENRPASDLESAPPISPVSPVREAALETAPAPEAVLAPAPAPVLAPVSENTPEASQEKASPLSGKRILLAEDNELNREIFITMLEDLGVTIDCAENGQAACDMVCGQQQPYDMIFMDIHMPVLDGYAAARRIRTISDAAATRVPIVAVTANCFPEDLEKSREAGMNGHIGKPVAYATLLSAMEACLCQETPPEFFTAQ